ncbi:MAG: hypothetical protein AB7V62_15210 [Thermoleophilia bacterium]
MSRGLAISRALANGEIVLVPLPEQVAFWHPHNFSEREAGAYEPQFLTCLKATDAGDRLLVWQGKDGGGITAVVDFGDPMRPDGTGRYQRWGCVTVLEEPISFERVTADPDLGPRLTGKGGRALQGKPVLLSDHEAFAVSQLTSLPLFTGPDRNPTPAEFSAEPDLWRALKGLPPEQALEAAVALDAALWQAIGFRTAPTMQKRLPSGRRPDLLAPGLVGEVKRVVRVNDGPEQIEEYIAELEAIHPESAPWRGVLLQISHNLDDYARQRVKASTADLEVWSARDDSEDGLQAFRLA